MARRMHFPLHPCPEYPPQQLDRVMSTCIVEDRRSRDGAAVQHTPALFCFASSSKPAKWRSSVIAQSSTFPSFPCNHPATCRSCHVTGDSWYVSECSGDAFCPALSLKTMQNDLCKRWDTSQERPPYPGALSSATPRAASASRRGTFQLVSLAFRLTFAQG